MNREKATATQRFRSRLGALILAKGGGVGAGSGQFGSHAAGWYLHKGWRVVDLILIPIYARPDRCDSGVTTMYYFHRPLMIFLACIRPEVAWLKLNLGCVVLCSYSFLFISHLRVNGDEPPKSTLQVQRERLASIKTGMTSDEVVRLLGRPDEVRPVDANNLLDGTRLGGNENFDVGDEKERWAYGVLGRGLFAKIGYVGIDRNQKVVASVPADCFAHADWSHFDKVVAHNEDPVPTPAKMRCLISPIQRDPPKGVSSESFKTTIKLKNEGSDSYEVKIPRGFSFQFFAVIEVSDASGTVLYREDRWRSTPGFVDRNWPALTIPAYGEVSEEFWFWPTSGFGPLPPGTYSVRAYFPFKQPTYYPSNRMTFLVP